MSWHSSAARNYKPNVFGPGFSWYQDKPGDDPMKAQKTPQNQQVQQAQNPQFNSPQFNVPQVSWQNPPQPAPNGQYPRTTSTVWLLAAVAVIAVALFALFSR